VHSDFGKLSERGFRPCQDLPKLENVRLPWRANLIIALSPDPIANQFKAVLDSVDSIHFQKTSKQVSVRAHGHMEAEQCMRGGQAHQPASISKRKTVRWRQETSGIRRRKPKGTKLIEKPRWKILKHWHSPSEVIENWNQQWM